jgi:hypothetical protein
MSLLGAGYGDTKTSLNYSCKKLSAVYTVVSCVFVIVRHFFLSGPSESMLPLALRYQMRLEAGYSDTYTSLNYSFSIRSQ